MLCFFPSSMIFPFKKSTSVFLLLIIIPKGTGYVCDILYKTINEEGEINNRWYSRIVNGNRIAGIDFGMVNIITMGNNIGLKPIAIKDGGIRDQVY